jgi:hypothetical protein
MICNKVMYDLYIFTYNCLMAAVNVSTLKLETKSLPTGRLGSCSCTVSGY